MDKLPDISDLLKYFQQFQGRLQQAQRQLAEQRFEASSGGGMVVAVVNGRSELVDVKISPEVIDPNDPEMLEDMVKAAVTAAVEKSRRALPAELSALGSVLDVDMLRNLFGGK